MRRSRRSILVVVILGAATLWAAVGETAASAAGAVPTSVSLASSDNPSLVAEQVIYTATVTPAPDGGTVSFTSDGTAIPGCQSAALNASGVATCAQVSTSGGTQSIVAAYSGDSTYAGSLSATLAQAVEDGRVPVLVLLASSSGSPSTVGQQVTYTASVIAPGARYDGGPMTAPTGTVSFTDAGTPVPGCQSLATLTVGDAVGDSYPHAACTQTDTSLGTHSIVATYDGDSVYAVSSSPSLIRTVSPPVPPAVTATSLTVLYSNGPPWTPFVSPEPRYAVYTATVAGTDNGGSLSFTVSGNVANAFHLGSDGTLIAGCQALPLNAAGQATCILQNEGCQLRVMQAFYSGDNAYAQSSSSAEPILGIGGCALAYGFATSLSLTSSGSPSLAGDQVTYTATVTPHDPAALLSNGPINGTVLFTDQGGVIPGCGLVSLSASGAAACTWAYTNGGPHSIVATYTGRFPYDASTATLMQTVTPKPVQPGSSSGGGSSSSSGGGGGGGGGSSAGGATADTGVGTILTPTVGATGTVPAAAPLTPPTRTTASTATGFVSLTISSLKTVHLRTKHPALAFTVTLSKPSVLHLTLLNANGTLLASWMKRETAGKHTLTFVLPAKALHAGHGRLRITETGNASRKTVGVSIAP